MVIKSKLSTISASWLRVAWTILSACRLLMLMQGGGLNSSLHYWLVINKAFQGGRNSTWGRKKW